MAVDQDALDHFEPIIAALEARIAALEDAGPAVPGDGDVVYIPPDSIDQNWTDRPSVRYEKV